MNLRILSFEVKFLEMSSMNPRYPKSGQSSITILGISLPPAFLLRLSNVTFAYIAPSSSAAITLQLPSRTILYHPALSAFTYSASGISATTVIPAEGVTLLRDGIISHTSVFTWLYGKSATCSVGKNSYFTLSS